VAWPPHACSRPFSPARPPGLVLELDAVEKVPHRYPTGQLYGRGLCYMR